MEFRIGDKYESYDMIYKYHYSKVMPRLNKYYIIVSNNGKDIGTITLGWGTQPLGTIKKIFPNHNLTTKNYLEIGKMCFLPEYNNSNFGSKIMSGLINFVRLNKDIFNDILFIYTLADGIMGKPGYIYQASNFHYIGSFDTLVYFNESTGEKIHPRTAKKMLIENAIMEGKQKLFWLTYPYMEKRGISKIQGKMYRYIYPIGDKAKRILKKYNYNFKNPKQKDIKWYKMTKGNKEEIDMPKFNMKIEDGFNSKNINSFIT